MTYSNTLKPDGFYVQFSRYVVPDDYGELPASFWPSYNESDPGYCPPHAFDAAEKQAKARMASFERGDWYYTGVRAIARCFVVRNGTGTSLNLESPGVWGIESDRGDDYLNKVYEDQVTELKAIIAAMVNPIYETTEG